MFKILQSPMLLLKIIIIHCIDGTNFGKYFFIYFMAYINNVKIDIDRLK
jgi:hypothetical protein